MPIQIKQLERIRQILNDWYSINKRNLPWRNTKVAYKIWVSEIILQQTRVNQGYNYYVRFIKHFPDIKSLANAEEQEVLKLWQGLGYYSRARNLHKTAKILVEKHNGKFPDNFKDIISLPGIGEYTASAICSFAYNLPYAAVDGNIFRVLSRLFANETPIDTSKGKREFTEIAQKLLDKNNSGTHNQAIMEFGAMYCIPNNPDCENCPLNEYCKTYKLDLVDRLPVKQGKIKTTKRYFNYFFIKQGEFTYIQKRTEKDIWMNLFEFPLYESEKPLELKEILESEFFLKHFENKSIVIENSIESFRHILSHQTIHAAFFTLILTDEISTLKTDFLKIKLNELEIYPISRLTDMFLERISLHD